MRKPIARFSFMAATLTLFGVAQQAAANDNKLVSGSFCRLTGSTDATVGAGDSSIVGDGLVNGTLSTHRVTCPIVRDSTDEPIVALFARVLDTTTGLAPAFTPRCRINRLASDGSHEMGNWALHENPSSGATHNFDSISVVDDFDIPLHGSTSVGCDIGAFDTIVGLRWEEDDATASNDIKVIAGNACYDQRANSNSAPGWPEGQGWFQAPSSNQTFADCPIVRDNTSAEVLGVWIRLDIASSGGEAQCTLVTRGVGSASWDTSDPETRSNDGTIHFNAAEMDEHFSGGSYAVSCRLPAGARLLSVRWDED